MSDGIIVGVDGSIHSIATLRWALQDASAHSGAKVARIETPRPGGSTTVTGVVATADDDDAAMVLRGVARYLRKT
jgi:hypothetical protein